MNELTTLEKRALARVSTADGHMLIVAADQRNGMKAVMKDGPGGPDAVTREQLADAKGDLVRHLAAHAPAILLDPEVAFPQLVDEGVLDAAGTALVVGMDASGFDTVDGLRHTRFSAGVTPRTVRDLGGDAAKMLWYLRPDRQDSGSDAVRGIRELVEACSAEGVLLIVEILTYRLEDETGEQYAERFPQLVVDATRLAVEAGAKVLKLPYPGSAEACAAVTGGRGRRAVGGPVGPVSTTPPSSSRSAPRWPTAPAAPWPGAPCGRTRSRSPRRSARSFSPRAPSRGCASCGRPSTAPTCPSAP